MSNASIAASAWHLLIALGVLALVFELYLALKRWPLIGWIALGGFIAVASDFPALPALLTVHGISLHPEDAMAAVLLMDTAPRGASLRDQVRGNGWQWIGFLALTALSMATGISRFGLGTSANELRELLQLLVALAWAMSQIREPGFEKRLHWFVQLLGWALTAVALYHVAVRGLGSADVQILQDNEYVTNRPLVAGQALVLALLGVYGIVRRRCIPASVLFLAVAALCQHRSVWAAIAGGFAVLLLLGGSRMRWRLTQMGLIGVVVVVLLWSFDGLGDLPSKVAYDLQSRGTLNGRTFDFSTLIRAQNHLGLWAILHGQPFGTGFLRQSAAGLPETYPPHDWYVVLYLRVGLIGVALMASIMVTRLVRHLTQHDALQAVWIVLIGVFALAYHLPWYIGPFLGLALAHSAFGLPDSLGSQTPAAIESAELAGV